MRRIKSKVHLALNVRWFKEMGEVRFRNWCNSTITNTKDEVDTENIIAEIKAEIQKEEE